MNNGLNDYKVISALCEINSNMAVVALEDENLETNRLATIIENSICGNIVNSETKEVVKLPNDVIMKGLLSLIDRY
jgi:hypothetical protein